MIPTHARYIAAMHVVCVARHPILSEHLGRLFEPLGVQTTPCVGLREALDLVEATGADAVICDYDLLAALPAEQWETDPVLEATPIIAVSLTREPGEAHLLETKGVAAFYYLPTLEPDEARQMLDAVRSQRRAIIPPPDALPWKGPKSVTELR